jgi:hypothetical protein
MSWTSYMVIYLFPLSILVWQSKPDMHDRSWQGFATYLSLSLYFKLDHRPSIPLTSQAPAAPPYPSNPYQCLNHDFTHPSNPHPPFCLSSLLGTQQNGVGMLPGATFGQWCCQAVRAIMPLPWSLPRDHKTPLCLLADNIPLSWPRWGVLCTLS